MLSRHAVQPQASDATASQGVDRLDLTLSFRSTSGRSKAKKPKLSVSSSDSQTQSHSQSQSPETASQTQLSQPPEVTLTSHLLSPSSLHFTLVPQLTTALERLAKKLVVAFPLCFNPKWQDVSARFASLTVEHVADFGVPAPRQRLANDLSAQHSIAQSLCNILGLDASKDRSIKPHDAEVEKKAGLLELVRLAISQIAQERKLTAMMRRRSTRTSTPGSPPTARSLLPQLHRHPRRIPRLSRSRRPSSSSPRMRAHRMRGHPPRLELREVTERASRRRVAKRA